MKGSHNGVSDNSSPDVINTASENLAKFPDKIVELGGKVKAIEKLLRIKGIEEQRKYIQIEYGMEKGIFDKIQQFRKKYLIKDNGKFNIMIGIFKIFNEQNGIEENKEQECIDQGKRLSHLDDQLIERVYKKNCDIERSLNKTLDETRQFIREIDVDPEQHTQEKGLPRFAKDELVSQARRLEKSLRETRDSLREVLIDQAQMLGKFDYLYALEHQRHDYKPEGPNRTLFNQGNRPICGSTCTAMLVSDRMSRKEVIRIARKEFPCVEFDDNETVVEIVRKAVQDVKRKRGNTLIAGSALGDEVVVLNNFLASTGKGGKDGEKYVYLQNVRDDELQYFVQASTKDKERGSIEAAYSHMKYNHGVIVDSEQIVEIEERVNIRCPSLGPFVNRRDLFSRYFTGDVLIPAATWQEFVAECKNKKRQTQILRLVPDPSSQEIRGVAVDDPYATASQSVLRKQIWYK